MKNFKQYLKEFKMNDSRRGGGGSSGDPIESVFQFMERTPVELRTREGGTLQFDSAYEAANAFHRHLLEHDEGHAHAVRSKNEPMIKYFGKSAKTHEDAIDFVTSHIQNHADLPDNLKPYVPTAMDRIAGRIENEHTKRKNQLKGQIDIFGRPLSNFGRRVAKAHQVRPIYILGDVRHPYEDDDAHHMKGIIEEMDSSDPDIPPIIRGQYIPPTKKR